VPLLKYCASRFGTSFILLFSGLFPRFRRFFVHFFAGFSHPSSKNHRPPTAPLSRSFAPPLFFFNALVVVFSPCLIFRNSRCFRVRGVSAFSPRPSETAVLPFSSLVFNVRSSSRGVSSRTLFDFRGAFFPFCFLRTRSSPHDATFLGLKVSQ